LAVSDANLAEMTLPATSRRRPAHRPVFFQFVQFCLVGALSTALNLSLFNLFMARGFGVTLAHVCAFSLAVTNGFFVNRAWTFRHSQAGKMDRQYKMFVAVNLVGMGLTWVVMQLMGAWLLHTQMANTLAHIMQARIGHLPVPERLAYSLGELAATPLCAIWNFTANKLWTFGGTRADGEKQ
jgi:putative flippase GtrA